MMATSATTPGKAPGRGRLPRPAAPARARSVNGRHRNGG